MSKATITLAEDTGKQSPTVEISATELEVNGTVATATVTTDGPAVTLSTSDPAVASVSGTTVTAVGAGTATITATWEENETHVGGTKTFTVTVLDNTPVVTDWEKTELSALTASDIFVIVGNNGSNYALANNKGTSAAPTAVSVTVNGNYLTGTVADNIKWNVSGNATDGYTFYPNGSTTTWLYTTSDNNGVRVGTNNNKLFTIDQGYLKNSETSRYVGIYNSADWRCYTSINNNIKDQTFTFYKYTGAPAPSVTAEAVEISYDATSGSISYTINNGVEGGTLAATTEADWLTIGTVGEVVPFTTTANGTVIGRTADVVLTYTYGTATTSRTITVTQTGNPNGKGSENNPLTVAEALEATPASGNSVDVYIIGTVSQFHGETIMDDGTNFRYYLSDDGTTESDQLLVYKGKGLNNVDFSNASDLTVGEVVVIKGQLTNFHGTKEVAAGNYIVREVVPVTISAAGYSTLYYGTKNLTVPTGMEAYTVKVTTKVERSKTYNAGDVIPAGEPVVLKAAADTYEFTVAAEAGAKDANNMLKGNDVKTLTTGGTYYYALTLNANKDIDSAGFYWMVANGGAYQAGAHKAYLALDKTFTELAEGTSTGVKGFLALPGNDADGIESIDNATIDNAKVFNLAGQRVKHMNKGIYVVGGKKVMVK